MGPVVNFGQDDKRDHLTCPITNELFRDPVLCNGDGYTYERSAIEQWIASGKTQSPMTGADMAVLTLVPNFQARSQADDVRGYVLKESRPSDMPNASATHAPKKSLPGSGLYPPNGPKCAAPQPGYPDEDYSTRAVARPQPRLKLVAKNDPSVFKLSEQAAQLLASGESTPLVTESGVAIGPYWKEPRNAWGHWRYIELGVGSDVQPLRAKLDGPYVVWDSCHGEMVFDVAMWKLEAGNHLVVVQATPGNPGGPTRMSKDACGRDFVLNSDGTISPRTAQHLVLGGVVVAGSSGYASWSSPMKRIDARELAGDWCCWNPFGTGCSRVKPLDGDTFESFGCCLWFGPGGFCMGGEVRSRIPNTNRFRHHKDANNVTNFSSANFGCNCWTANCKVPCSRWTPRTGLDVELQVPEAYRWKKITAYEIAKGSAAGSGNSSSHWCCGCWCIPCGLAKFTKHGASDDEDTLVHKGICFFNGLCCPFEEKRYRVYAGGVPTNGFHKEGDEGNVDWYACPSCVGNGASCSFRC